MQVAKWARNHIVPEFFLTKNQVNAKNLDLEISSIVKTIRTKIDQSRKVEGSLIRSLPKNDVVDQTFVHDITKQFRDDLREIRTTVKSCTIKDLNKLTKAKAKLLDLVEPDLQVTVKTDLKQRSMEFIQEQKKTIESRVNERFANIENEEDKKMFAELISKNMKLLLELELVNENDSMSDLVQTRDQLEDMSRELSSVLNAPDTDFIGMMKGSVSNEGVRVHAYLQANYIEGELNEIMDEASLNEHGVKFAEVALKEHSTQIETLKEEIKKELFFGEELLEQSIDERMSFLKSVDEMSNLASVFEAECNGIAQMTTAYQNFKDSYEETRAALLRENESGDLELVEENFAEMKAMQKIETLLENPTMENLKEAAGFISKLVAQKDSMIEEGGTIPRNELVQGYFAMKEGRQVDVDQMKSPFQGVMDLVTQENRQKEFNYQGLDGAGYQRLLYGMALENPSETDLESISKPFQEMMRAFCGGVDRLATSGQLENAAPSLNAQIFKGPEFLQELMLSYIDAQLNMGQVGDIRSKLLNEVPMMYCEEIANNSFGKDIKGPLDQLYKGLMNKPSFPTEEFDLNLMAQHEGISIVLNKEDEQGRMVRQTINPLGPGSSSIEFYQSPGGAWYEIADLI